MRIFFVAAFLMGLAACSPDLGFEQERDGGIGGTGIYTGETLPGIPVV